MWLDIFDKKKALLHDSTTLPTMTLEILLRHLDHYVLKNKIIKRWLALCVQIFFKGVSLISSYCYFKVIKYEYEGVKLIKLDRLEELNKMQKNNKTNMTYLS